MKKLLIVYRLYDPAYGDKGNPKTLAVRLNEDKTIGYAYYGGWQDGGTPFSISNMQLKESLPLGSRNFKKVEDLDKTITQILATGVGSRKIKSREILNDL